MGLFEHFTRLVEATGGDEVVEEAGEVAGAQGLGEDRGGQGKTTGPASALRGEREPGGADSCRPRARVPRRDAEPDFRLLQSGFRLPERGVRERSRLFPVAPILQR